LRLWLISLLLGLLPQDGNDLRYRIPYGELNERHREKLKSVMKNLTTTVPLPLTRVESRSEIYTFLLEELPFTAEVCRALGKASYDVFRDPRVPEEKAALEKWRGTYFLDDRKGMKLRVERVIAEKERRIFYTYGSYKMSGLPKIRGRSVIVVVWNETEGILATEAKVFLQVTTPVFRTLAGIGRGLVEKMVRKKSTLFIQAARWVAEAARKDPAALYEKIRDDENVDPEVRKEFHRRFLQP
jgi:hypothetical protein